MRPSTGEFPRPHQRQANAWRPFSRPLPMSPAILIEVQRRLSDGVSGAGQISKVIRNDPALVATVLRLVNSAAFGLPHAVQRPTAAIAYLGTDEVYRLVVTATLFNTFTADDQANLQELWRHATLTALASRELVRTRARWLSSSMAWTLGLLHDIGSLVYITVAPEEARAAAQHRANHRCLPEETEAALGLVASTEVARGLCHTWRLPFQVELAATRHRTGRPCDGATEDDATMLAYVSAASYLTRLVSEGLRDDVRFVVTDRIQDILQCDAGELWELLSMVHGLREEADVTATHLAGGAAAI